MNVSFEYKKSFRNYNQEFLFLILNSNTSQKKNYKWNKNEW